MFVSLQSRSILFYMAAVFPLTVVLLVVTTVYAECNNKVPANIECQTNLPDNDCKGLLVAVPPAIPCSQDTEFVSTFEGNFGRETQADSNEHTELTTDAEDEQNCYKYNTCHIENVVQCVQHEEKIAKAPVYSATPCP